MRFGLLLVALVAALPPSGQHTDFVDHIEASLKGRAVSLRQPCSEERLSVSPDGALMCPGPPASWTLNGVLQVESVKLDDRVLLIRGKRVIGVYDEANKKIEFIPTTRKVTIGVGAPAALSKEQGDALVRKLFLLGGEDYSEKDLSYWRAFEAVPPGGGKWTPVTLATGTVYRVGDGVSPPKPEKTPDPEYPEPAREGGFIGTVYLRAIIDASGRVSDIAFTREAGTGFADKSAETISRWRFQPAKKKDGTPVPVLINVEVNFRH